jgi:YtfJ family uncharacterized protein
MAISRMIISMLLILASGSTLAGTPAVDSPLPLLSISERGELIMAGDDFSFVPWSSASNPGKVHVIQYFGANMGDRDVFKPFTDLLQTSVEPGTVHVTTVLNLDAALWGTTGFVISELEKNKRIHPLATMVLDEEGTGVVEWDLGKAGTGLIVMDEKGMVKYFTRQSMSEEELAATLELVRSNSQS